MAIFKCKMCGGDITLSEDKTFGTCEYCGCTMTLPKVSDEQRLAAFNRGNHFRRSGEFDKALAVYERIVAEDDADAEAHWCCALCRFGIEYVEDPTTYEYIPTCHRLSFNSFLEDVDYLAAVEHSDGITRRQYQKDAAKIAEVQRGILATSQNEEPFDVFLCYKESAEDGQRTKDSTLAQDIYYQLTEQGRRVFFARITLEDKAGTEYEPYIFAALNSARVMVVVGTKPEYFNAVWVKNEWSRFLTLMKKDRTKLLLPCYRDMDPYDLPEALSVLQSYDMSKIGFMQDLTRGITKVLDAEKKPEPVKETVVVQQASGGNAAPLLKRAFMFLEDGDWAKADDFCEQVLNIEPENAEAYLGKLMAELRCGKREALKDQAEPFDDSSNYHKALRFSNDALKAELTGDIEFINDRNETARKDGIYNDALAKMRSAAKELDYKAAADLFQSISGFQDAYAKAVECREKAEIARKDAIYSNAMIGQKNDMESTLLRAIDLYSEIPGWKDAEAQISVCQQRIEELKAQAEQARLAAEQTAKKRKKIIAITTPVVCAVIAFVIVLNTVIIPSGKYNKAVELYNAGEYDEAIMAFEALGDYKDAADQVPAAHYAKAEALRASGDYAGAVAAFTAMGDYKDAPEQILATCYAQGEALLAKEDFDGAVKAFTNAGKYQDAAGRILATYYAQGEALAANGRYIKAIEAFIASNGYNDAAEKIMSYQISAIKEAKVGETVFFGTYEQDNDTSNGKETIEWLVLDKQDGKVLVISKYALDCQPYNSLWKNVTWEKCTLRSWLNDSFLKNAFTTEEQAQILTTSVSADKKPEYDTNPGNATTDKVFLLSIAEAEKYFTSDTARQAAPTKYAIAQGAYTSESNKTASGEAACWWWLRSPAYAQNYAASVNIDGSVNYFGYNVDRDNSAVRPALWVSLE